MGKIRMGKVTPSDDGVPINGDDTSEAEVMRFVVMKEAEAADVTTKGMVEGETQVALLGHQASGNAMNGVYKDEPAGKIVLFNINRMHEKQDIFIANTIMILNIRLRFILSVCKNICIVFNSWFSFFHFWHAQL